MDISTLIGLSAAFITSSSFLPQIFRCYRLKSSRDISLTMLMVLLLGLALWLIYGLMRGDPVIIIANVIGIGSNLVLMVMKFVYR